MNAYAGFVHPISRKKKKAIDFYINDTQIY